MKTFDIKINYYIKSAYRSLMKNKYFTLLNIAGLSVGVAVVILILLWVQDELSYDKFHKNHNEIARILMTKNGEGGPAMIYPLAELIKNGVPEILNITQFIFTPSFVVNYGDKSFYETKALATDTAFLQIFSFPLVSGNIKEALSDPKSVVLTQKTAKKYFGEEDPIGKTLEFDGIYSFKITGVLKEIPKNSHLEFDLLLPLQNFIDGSYNNIRIDTQWGSPSFYAYILLSKNRNDSIVGKKITKIAYDNKAPHIFISGREFEIQALNNIYTHPYNVPWEYAKGDLKMIYIFSLIAVLILIIACFNYINLSTAVIQKRMRSIGFYKIIGATRTQLIIQLLGEAFIISLISICLALFIAKLLMPTFNMIAFKQLELNIIDTQLLGYLFMIFLFIGFTAGFYPAIALSRFKPIVALKGESSNSFNLIRNSKTMLRKSLVIIQFIIAISLIVGTIVIHRQFNFAISSSWKTDKDFVIHFPVKENIGKQFNSFKNRLLQHPNIVSMSMKDCLPTKVKNSTNSIFWDGKGDEMEDTYFERSAISYDYFKTLDIDVIYGREFSPGFGTDSILGFIIDESLLKFTTYHDPIGKNISLYKNSGKIIGVVENKIFKPIVNQPYPTIYYLIPNGREADYGGDVFIKVNGIDPKSKNNALKPLIDYLETEWKSINKIAPFEYHFLDETIRAQYDTEKNLGRMISYFSIFTIFISCLGLLGLVSAISNFRIKEIAIRKVNGAHSGQIFRLLLFDFMKLILIATFIACPIAWYSMNQWLQTFVLKIKLAPWIFIVSSGIVALVAIITLCIQTYQAASRNPIESLKYE